MAAILHQEVPAPDCDPDLAAAITGMLARDPGQRWTIPQIREALAPVAGRHPGASPSNPKGWTGPVPPSRVSDVPAVPASPADPQAATGTQAPTGPASPYTPPPPGPLTAAAPQRQGQAAWDEGARTGMWQGTPTSYAPKPSTAKAPLPTSKPLFSRKTLIITASVALVVAVAGTVGGIFLTKSGGSPLSLRATLANPGKVAANDLVFSPADSTLVATDNAHDAAVGQNSASVFNTAAAVPVPPGFAYAGLGYSLAYSPDGTRLAIAGADLYVWNTTNHAPVAYIPNVSPQAVAFGQDAHTLAVGGRWASTSSDEVELLNPDTHQWTATMPGLAKNSYISAVAFAPDGTTLAASDTANGLLYVWNTSSRSLVTAPVPLTSAAGPLAFSPDGKTLAVSTGATGSVRLWNVAGKSWSAPLTDANSKGVKGIAYNSDGKTLAVADGNGTVNLWNTATGKLIVAKQVSPKGVASVAFSPDGKALATGDAAGNIELWALSGS
jgi:hypothetical protein